MTEGQDMPTTVPTRIFTAKAECQHANELRRKRDWTPEERVSEFPHQPVEKRLGLASKDWIQDAHMRNYWVRDAIETAVARVMRKASEASVVGSATVQDFEDATITVTVSDLVATARLTLTEPS